MRAAARWYTCNGDAPGWERIWRDWKGKGVQFVGVGLLDSKEACLGFVRKHGLTFANGYDGEGRVAKDGTLVRAGFGPSGEAELVSMLRSITR